MKLITITILILFIASVFPLDAFCDDHSADVDDQHHCLMVCHDCHVFTPPSKQLGTSPSLVSTLLSNHSFLYQEPHLDTSDRPPLSSV